MDVDLLNASSRRWSGFLSSVRHDFYHLPGYASLCADREGGFSQGLLVEHGSSRLLLPLIVRDLGSGRRDAVSPYGYPGPLTSGTDDRAFIVEALRAASRSLRERGFVSAFIRLHPILNPTMPEGVGTLVAHGETVSVDLTLPDDIVWGQTRRDHRHDIRRSIGLGWVARMDEDWLELQTFSRLYAETMERRSAAEQYRFDIRDFRALRRVLGDRLHLCLVEGHGIAAAGLFVETCGIVQFHLSGSDQTFAPIQPTKLMLHFVEAWARARGDLVLHLGGGVGARNDSLHDFKAAFSPRRHPFVTLRMVIDAGEYARRVAALDPYLDPGDDAGFFPLYRRPTPMSSGGQVDPV